MCVHAQVRVQLLVVSSLLPWGGPWVGLWPCLERLSINLMACEDPASSEKYHPLGRGPELKQKGERGWAHGASMAHAFISFCSWLWLSCDSLLSPLWLLCQWAATWNYGLEYTHVPPYIAFGEQQKWNQDPGGAANWPWESNSKQKGDTWFSGFVSQFSHV